MYWLASDSECNTLEPKISPKLLCTIIHFSSPFHYHPRIGVLPIRRLPEGPGKNIDENSIPGGISGSFASSLGDSHLWIYIGVVCCSECSNEEEIIQKG